MNAHQREECRCSLAAGLLISSGNLRLRASGASMLPTLWPGDLLSVESISSDRLQAGDLVLYQRYGRFFVHRVVSKSDSGETVTTRGDCMAAVDAPIPRADVLGRVVQIRRGATILKPAGSLSALGAVYACILQRSDLCTRIVLRLHAMRTAARPDFEMTPERAAW